MQKIQEKAPLVARVLLGLVFLVFGLNGFLGFIPQPPHDGAALEFLSGLAAASYFFPLLKASEVVVGVLLLSGRLVPLALTVLAPITVQIVAFHAFLEPATVAMPLFLMALHLFLAWSYRDAFRGVLDANARPTKRERATAPRTARAAG